MSRYVDYRVCPEVSSAAGQTDLCQQFSVSLCPVLWQQSLFEVRPFPFSFQAFGWCPKGNQCLLSHDTDLIILQDEKTLKDNRRKRKRQREKKKEGDKAAEDASAFDSAPENKIAHMMAEAAEDNQRRPEMLPESDGDGRQDDGGSNRGEDKSLVPSGDGRAPASKTANTGTHRAGFDAFMTGYVFAHARTIVGKAVAEPEGEEPWLPTCLNKVHLSGKAAPLNVVKSCFSRSSKAHLQKMEMVWGQ